VTEAASATFGSQHVAAVAAAEVARGGRVNIHRFPLRRGDLQQETQAGRLCNGRHGRPGNRGHVGVVAGWPARQSAVAGKTDHPQVTTVIRPVPPLTRIGTVEVSGRAGKWAGGKKTERATRRREGEKKKRGGQRQGWSALIQHLQLLTIDARSGRVPALRCTSPASSAQLCVHPT